MPIQKLIGMNRQPVIFATYEPTQPMTKTVTLGEICEYARTGKTPSTFETKYFGDEVNWYTPGDFTGKELSSSKRGLTNIAFKDKKATMFDAGSVLITCIGEIGKVGIIREKASSNQQITAIKPKADVLSDFLYYFLIKNKSKLEDSANNAVVPIINSTKLKEIAFQYPPLPEQRRIAALLDHADALRQKDRQLLAHYDKLAQSVFLDLFGDPVKNEKVWERVKIRDLVREVKYGTSKPAENEGAFPYLRMNNITYEGHWNFTDLKYINLTKTEEAKYLLQKGDLVFNRTNSKELVGKTAVYQRDDQMAIAGYLIRSRVNDKATPEYISAYLNSKHGKETLRGMCKSIIGMANINAQELQEIDILQPPLPLQTHFANVIEQIERQKGMVRQQMAASEGLFGRLLQESFG